MEINNNMNKKISKVIVNFHHEVKKFLKGKSMVDGYTITIRDAIEAAKFINRFKDSIGLERSIVLGISSQYLSKLKNEDKPDILDALREIDLSGFSEDGLADDIETIIYPGGTSRSLDLANVIGAREDEQLANLFRVLTRRAPQTMRRGLDILHRMLISNDKDAIGSAIESLSFLPDGAKKLMVEMGVDIYSDDKDVFYNLIKLSTAINDDGWKQMIIEDKLLTLIWNDTDNESRKVMIDTVYILSRTISDNGWKHNLTESAILKGISGIDVDIKASSAGLLWALSGADGNERRNKELISNTLLAVMGDNDNAVASWSIKAAGLLCSKVTDSDWTQKFVSDHIQPRFFHKSEAVRLAAVEACGTILEKLDEDSFKQEFTETYLLEKLFDQRDVQLEVMESLTKIFSSVNDEDWMQSIIELNLIPKLKGRREIQSIIISRMQNLFMYIKNDEWKQNIVKNSLLPKLGNRDWYVHAETLKTLGSLNKSIKSREWKIKIMEEHILMRLAFDDSDIECAALQAIGTMCDGTGTEEWRRGILENHILPKTADIDNIDGNVRSALYKAIGIIALGIEDDKWRQKIVNDYLTGGSKEKREIMLIASDAVCKLVTLNFDKSVAGCNDAFQENIDKYQSRDTLDALYEDKFDEAITETTDKVTIGRFTIEKNRDVSPHIPDASESVLVNTKTTVEDLEFLAASVLMDKPVLEIGPTATRKSSLIQYLAFLVNMPYRRFNLNGQTDKYEFIGGYKPQTVTLTIPEAIAVVNKTIDDDEYETIVSAVTRLTGEKHFKDSAIRYTEEALSKKNSYAILNMATLILNSESRLEWQDGILIEAIKNGYYLNLDELNLSETEVLERINSLLDDEQSIVVYEHENERYIKHDVYEELIEQYLRNHDKKCREEAIEYLRTGNIYKIHLNFRLFSTMNPKEYKGRNKLSDPFLNRWRILRIEELPDEEIASIIKFVYNMRYELVMPVVLFHRSISEQAEKGILGKRQREEYHFTIRDLIRVFRRVEEMLKGENKDQNLNADTQNVKAAVAAAVDEVYGRVFRDEEDRKKYNDFYRKAFGVIETSNDDVSSVDEGVKYIDTASDVKVIIGRCNRIEMDRFNENMSPYIPGEKSMLTPVKTTLKYIKTIAQSITMDEPIHLVGPTASAKTSIIRYIAHLTNSGFQRVSLAGQTETADILGQYQSTMIRGQYAWKDGTLLQAMINGDYLLLDELNLAEPQILERLNSWLDTGRLVISEHNNETYINARLYDKMVMEKKIEADDKRFMRVHENFRTVAASNPVDIRHQGRTRLSLAFRNRFREIWMEEINNEDELVEIVANMLV